MGGEKDANFVGTVILGCYLECERLDKNAIAKGNL